MPHGIKTLAASHSNFCLCLCGLVIWRFLVVMFILNPDVNIINLLGILSLFSFTISSFLYFHVLSCFLFVSVFVSFSCSYTRGTRIISWTPFHFVFTRKFCFMCRFCILVHGLIRFVYGPLCLDTKHEVYDTKVYNTTRISRSSLMR